MNRIRTKIEKCIRDGMYRNGMRQVNISEENGRIVLSGNVKTYFLKQMAQVVAMQVIDGMRLLNKISVDGDSQV